MEKRTIAAAALAALFLPPASDPQDASRAPADPQGALPSPLARDDVAELLSLSDLDRRERAFEDLAARAASDEDVRGLLGELAAAAGDAPLELAWTARLCLREAERAAADPLHPAARALLARWAADVRARVAPGLGAARDVDLLHLALALSLERGDADSVPGDGGRAAPETLRLRLHEAPARKGAGTRVPRHLLGVVVRGPAEGGGLDVTGVAPGTIAHVLGIARGDVLLEIDGERLLEPEDVTRALARRPGGGALTVVWRDTAGERRTGVWRP